MTTGIASLSDWYLSGKDLRQLVYEAGFNSPYAAGRFFDLDHRRMNKWVRLDVVPNGRILGLALLGLKYKAQVERLERELAVYKAKETQ